VPKCDNIVEIWLDRSVETMQQVEANHPDVVVVDFSVPCDTNVTGKEEEKNLKYSRLAHQVRRLHQRCSYCGWLSRCSDEKIGKTVERVGYS